MSKMTLTEWEEAEALYKTGAATAKDIAERFDQPIRTIYSHFAKKDIDYGSDVPREEIAEAVKEEVIDTVTLKARRVTEVKERHFKFAKNIDILTMKSITDAVKDKKSLETIAGDLKSLELASKIFKNTRDGLWKILDLDKDDGDEDELPELVIRDLTGQEIAAIRDKQQTDLNEDDVNELLTETEKLLADEVDDRDDVVIEE